MGRESKVSGTPSWKPIELKGDNSVNIEEETLLYGNAGVNLDNIGVSYDDGDLVRKVREAVQAKYGNPNRETTTTDAVDEEEKLAKELLDINQGKEPVKEVKQTKKSNKKVKVNNIGGEEMNIDNTLEKLASLLAGKVANMLKVGQQAELGKEGEKEEADLSVSRKDLGEVKTPTVTPSVTSSPVEPVKQKDVKKPSNEPQKEITTSKEESEEAKRGIKAQQAEKGEEGEKEIESEKNLETGKKDLGEVKLPGVKVQETTKTAQQAEKGEEGEKEIESEKNLEVGKKDLGEVKLPKVEVKNAPSVEATVKKTAQQAEKGEEGEKEIESEKNLEVGKKDLGEVKLPGVKVIEKGALTAEFIPQESKVDSYWKVSLNKKPVFAVSFRDAFGDIKEVGRNIKAYLSDFDYFRSEDYGRDLIDEVSKIGVKNTIDKWFRGVDGNIRVSIYKSSQVSGEAPNDAPKMSLDERVTDTLIPEKGKDKEEMPILELLANVLASLIVSSKDLSPDEITHQLKSIFSDDKLIERFTGTLKEKVSAISEKVKSEDGVEEGIKKVTSMFRTAQFASEIVNYLKKIKSDNNEVNAKINEYLNKLKTVESEKETLKTKVAKLENELYLRDKAKRVAEVVKKMIKKGLLKENEAQKKVEELMKKSDAAIDDFNNLVDGIESRVSLGKLNSVIPTVKSEEESGGDLFAGLFTKPPVVNENDRMLKIGGRGKKV